MAYQRLVFPLRLVPIAEDTLDSSPTPEPYNGPVCWYCGDPLPADSFDDPNTGACYCSSRCVTMADADNTEDR